MDVVVDVFVLYLSQQSLVFVVGDMALVQVGRALSSASPPPTGSRVVVTVVGEGGPQAGQRARALDAEVLRSLRRDSGEQHGGRGNFCMAGRAGEAPPQTPVACQAAVASDL